METKKKPKEPIHGDTFKKALPVKIDEKMAHKKESEIRALLTENVLRGGVDSSAVPGASSGLAMKVRTGLAVGMLAMLLGARCSWLDKPAPPACQGDPALIPCSCMNPATPDCPAPPSDTKRPDGGTS